MMISNLHTYLAVAKDSLAIAEDIAASQRRPKPNGERGFIITYDREHRSFKHSLIAIVFAGIYFEALIYIEGIRRIGKAKFKKIGKSTYEDKLRAIGIDDKALLKSCKRFRQSRNDLVHEKAVEMTSLKTKLRFAQKEARHAIAFLDHVTPMLSIHNLSSKQDIFRGKNRGPSSF